MNLCFIALINLTTDYIKDNGSINTTLLCLVGTQIIFVR